MAKRLKPGQSQRRVWLSYPGDKIAHPPFEFDGMVLRNIAYAMIEKRIFEAFERCCHVSGGGLAHAAGGKSRDDLVIVKAKEALFYVRVGKHLAHGFVWPMFLGLPNLREIGMAEIQDVKLEAQERF